MCRQSLQSTAFSAVASGLVKMSPVPLLKDSRGSSFGLLGLLGHSFVIMTSDLCRPVCWEECRRCLPSVRLMVSRWLLFSNLGCFSEPGPLLLSYPVFQHEYGEKTMMINGSSMIKVIYINAVSVTFINGLILYLLL